MADPVSAFRLMQSSAAGSPCRVAIHRSSQLHPTLNSAWSGRADRFFVPPQLRSWHQWNWIPPSAQCIRFNDDTVRKAHTPQHTS